MGQRKHLYLSTPNLVLVHFTTLYTCMYSWMLVYVLQIPVASRKWLIWTMWLQIAWSTVMCCSSNPILIYEKLWNKLLPFPVIRLMVWVSSGLRETLDHLVLICTSDKTHSWSGTFVHLPLLISCMKLIWWLFVSIACLTSTRSVPQTNSSSHISCLLPVETSFNLSSTFVHSLSYLIIHSVVCATDPQPMIWVQICLSS